MKNQVNNNIKTKLDIKYVLTKEDIDYSQERNILIGFLGLISEFKLALKENDDKLLKEISDLFKLANKNKYFSYIKEISPLVYFEIVYNKNIYELIHENLESENLQSLINDFNYLKTYKNFRKR